MLPLKAWCSRLVESRSMPLSFCVVAKFRVNDSAHDLVNVPSCGNIVGMLRVIAHLLPHWFIARCYCCHCCYCLSL